MPHRSLAVRRFLALVGWTLSLFACAHAPASCPAQSLPEDSTGRSAAPATDDANPNFGLKANWIGSGQSASGTGDSARMPVFRREFLLSGQPRRATLRISGLGQFEAHINGRNVTPDRLTPGWTDYRKRVFYDTYNVASLLQKGGNAIGVLLGNGMYNVVETKGRYTKFTGSFGAPKLIAQLDVTYADGQQESIATDEKWQTAPGPITYDSIYGGEDYDAALEQLGWDKPGFSAPKWSYAARVEGPGGKLVPESIPPVREFETYRPIRVTHPQAGVAVYDLGQNFSGWPEIAVEGPRGAQVKLLCGELLDEHGRVTQKSAYAFPDSEVAFHYALRGEGVEQWSPRFSYTGFRYVEVSADPREKTRILRVSGHFLHDDVTVDGHFASSDELFNRIHRLIDRAMLSNMFSVLTDCPHREKLGWLEQTHLAGTSLMYNYGLKSLYANMSKDIEDAQLPDGLVPDIAPEFPVFESGFRDSPEWGAASVLSAWTAYQFYGDADTLRTHYASMKSYIEYLHGRLENGLLSYGLGDWYDIGPGDPGESQLTSKGLTATAIYFQMLEAMEKAAPLTGHGGDAPGFRDEANRVKAAFNQAFFHPESGQYDRGSQTAQAMPLAVGLVPEEQRTRVLAKLIEDIHAHADHVTAGDVGFHYVVRALTDSGRSDVLYAMLSRTDKPSYGDQLAHGATTLTEAWDANPSSSQNHFMLGHAEEWFYRGLAGIDFDMSRNPDERIRIAPVAVGKLTWVSASYASALGTIESSWRRNGDLLTLNIVIPKGATATLVLPPGAEKAVSLDGKPLAAGGSVRGLSRHHGRTECVVAAGTFQFQVRIASNS